MTLSPIDPTRKTLTVRVSDSRSPGGSREVEGQLVVDGLAITPSVTPGQPGDDGPRFVLTHTRSGKCIPGTRCTKHINEAAEFVAAAGIDWTVDLDAIIADPKVKEVAQALQLRLGYCSRRCDRPEGPSWSVRCLTCAWQYEVDEEGSLDAREAKQVGWDHVCDKTVQLLPPGTDKWVDQWRVHDDGTIPSLSGGAA